MCSNQRPFHCIVPPYILQQIIVNGTPTQSQLAQRSMAASTTIREQRRIAPGAVGPETAALLDQKQRQVYSADQGGTLPGRLLRGEGDPPTGDPAVDEAYDGAGLTYDLFREVYDRNSIDNRGMAIKSTVHYLTSYDNAFWNGSQMVYGDGDEDLPPAERIFNRFTIAVDIIGHELAHGITQYEAGLAYQNQSGALNESMSDVFGSLVKQRARGETARQADWLIGAGLLADGVNGVALRSMQAPGTAYDDPVIGADPQPGHMDDYQDVAYDNGGVHINSGIPNRAFYLVAYELDGFAWEKAGRIWYVALRDRLAATADFQTAANVTWQVAGDLFGTGSLEQQAVQAGWNSVGIVVAADDPPDDPPPPDPDPTPDKQGCRPQLRSLLGF